ncbi:hypothetical protein F4779DRAFT_564601 [Xylariaceae sp. FL0662B]|nr:hypothetical protein F4779DRAFT_564601 [Xylariaceae sp. FL0662B]
MAARRVIADSDDEDGSDELMSPLKDEADPPKPEPLSPHHRPSSPREPSSHNHISDTTDQSFFASVYDEQQSRALKQSHLIENIVRQSQKASASSGDISLPAKGKGKKANVSSATDVTSPVDLKRPGNRQSMFSDNASEVTSPQKSTGREWDIPSSPEPATAPRSRKNSKGKVEKTYVKRKRGQSNSTANSATADIVTGDDVRAEQEVGDALMHEAMPDENREIQISTLPAVKKRKVSLHDSVQDSTNFYVAQSNLTTMQKLEYQKVNASQHSKAGLPSTLTNQKSSCATTIAYSTPHQYSSSGPPLPWEREGEREKDSAIEGSSVNVINLTSSPDVIATGHNHSEEAVVSQMRAHLVQDEAKPPIRSSPETLPRQKRKRVSKSFQDEDELTRDESWDSETIGYHRDTSKPKPNRQRLSTAELDISGNRDEQTVALNTHEKTIGEASEISTMRTRATAIDETEIDQPETEPTLQPKKRGRKKKQPTGEQVIRDEQDAEYQATAQRPVSVDEDPESQAELERPKKRRGRPRKSEPEKSDTSVQPSFEASVAVENRKGNARRNITASEKAGAPAEKPRKGKGTAKQREEAQELNDSASDRDSLPPEETNSNPVTPTQAPSEEVSGKPAEPKSQNAQPKSQPKEAPKPAASQTKALYRVGLSKRTRIAPLLKTIKK